MTSQHDKAKRWRPWQFSLRTLMFLIIVVATYLSGWMSNEWNQQRESERAKQEARARQERVQHFQTVIDSIKALPQDARATKGINDTTAP